MSKRDFSTQNIPVDINPDDPEVIRKLIDLSKQTLRKINEITERLIILETKVLE